MKQGVKNWERLSQSNGSLFNVLENILQEASNLLYHGWLFCCSYLLKQFTQIQARHEQVHPPSKNAHVRGNILGQKAETSRYSFSIQNRNVGGNMIVNFGIALTRFTHLECAKLSLCMCLYLKGGGNSLLPKKLLTAQMASCQNLRWNCWTSVSIYTKGFIEDSFADKSNRINAK